MSNSIFLSLILTFYILGINNLSFISTKWLAAHDVTTDLLSWKFFKNDIWRFPLGSNPNYGGEFGSSIIFSDSIPILALTFKLFKSLLPESFQYISLWYFICFYFQLFFSYKILKKFTNSSLYSFIGSIFFLTAPIFLWKLLMVPALAGHWILLFALYLGLSHKTEESKFIWIFIIILSSLINFYFMIII